MIYTVTLNPAIDQFYIVHSMSKTIPNAIDNKITQPAGKGINVSRVIQSLDEISIAVTFCGNDINDEFKVMIKEEGFPCYCFSIEDDVRTNIKLMNPVDNTVMEFNEKGPYIPLDKQKDLFDYFDERLDESDIVVLSGSVPKNCSATIYNDFIKRYKNRDITILLDTSNSPLQEGIKAGPDIITPNVFELEILCNTPLDTVTSIVDAAKSLLQHNIKEVIVSRGKDGTIYVANNIVYHVVVPLIEHPHVIGAGDAFVGGYIVGLKQNKDIVERLRYASAVALASILQEGTTPGTMDDITLYYDQIDIQKL